MTDHQLQAIRERLPEYVASVTTKSRAGFWVCPLCGSGTGPKKSGAFRIQGKRWMCFSCGRSGDVLDLIGEIERIPDFRDRARRATELLGISGSARAAGAAPVRREPRPELEPVYISPETMQASFDHYDQNDFAIWLCSIFGQVKALDLALMYRLGTSKHWPGACVFWQLDMEGRIRRGKVMLYNSKTGRRVRSPGCMVAGVHWLLGMADRKPPACLFGLHLVAPDSRPLAIVESEKTAMVCAGIVPEYTWLASGGKGALSRAMIEPLQGRRIVLFPDLGACDDWRAMASGWPGVTVSTVLEERATTEDRAAGLDVADYLLREHGTV